jgi:hypothetical protein
MKTYQIGDRVGIIALKETGTVTNLGQGKGGVTVYMVLLDKSKSTDQKIFQAKDMVPVW